MSRIVFMNDRLVPGAAARVSVFAHGLLYGDGVFEGMRSYSGRVFRMEAHLDRLWDSARAIALEIPMTKEAVAKAVNDTLAANKLPDGYVRLIITRGAGTLGLDPNRTSHPQVIVIARISKSGNAAPQAGDLVGQTDEVAVGAGALKVEIRDRFKP